MTLLIGLSAHTGCNCGTCWRIRYGGRVPRAASAIRKVNACDRCGYICEMCVCGARTPRDNWMCHGCFAGESGEIGRQPTADELRALRWELARGWTAR